MATYLVTGGAGFIGSHVVEELVSRGEQVRVVDSLVSVRDPPALPGRHPKFDSSGIGMRNSPT